ncbi:MAG: hypothetical protein RLZZ105_791 [Actinomycetota bacterium]
MSFPVVFADTTTTIAWVILLASVLGWVIYGLANLRSSKREIGAEIKLAANRKPYYDDERLEGEKIERTQLIGLAFLAVTTIALPLYWILEPGRMVGAEKEFEHIFEEWGSGLFATTADGGFNCAGCHGGMNGGGGVASYSITDPNTSEVKQVNWKAPAINTVFYRYSEEEVRFILEYGRPFSPMSAWGLVGGGPRDANGKLPDEKQKEIQDEAERLVKAGTYSTIGEALFNLDLGGGNFSCARCHTKGWSYGDPQITGGGAFGPNLTGGSVVRQFPQRDEMIAFIKGGSEFGKKYGQQGQGSGRMPAFGLMLTDDQIAAVIDYVRGL